LQCIRGPKLVRAQQAFRTMSQIFGWLDFIPPMSKMLMPI
jgi:hypothetical protein